MPDLPDFPSTLPTDQGSSGVWGPMILNALKSLKSGVLAANSHVTAIRNGTNAVAAVAAPAGGGLGTKIDVPNTGIVVYPQGNRPCVVEFGAVANQTVAGAGTVYLSVVDVTPDITTRAILGAALVPLPNSIAAAQSKFSLNTTFDLGVLTGPRVVELQVLVYSASGVQPGISLVNSATSPTYLRQRGQGVGYSVSASAGRIASGESDVIWTPHQPWAGPGVILCHGRGELSQFTHATTQRSSVLLAGVLAQAGIPCISGDMGDTGSLPTWGSDVSVTRVGQAWTALQAACPTIRTDKVTLLGVSMGALAAARWAQANPSKVTAFVGLIPLFDLIDFYANNPNIGQNQAEIATSWGLGSKTLTDVGMTSGSPNITSATGFASADVGRHITNVNGINNPTTILSQTGGAAVMSSNATSTGTGRTCLLTDPLPTPKADIIAGVAAVANIPHLLGYSSADATVLPAWVTAYAAGLSAVTAQVTDGTFGHSDQAVGGMNPQTVLNFVMANA